jgi:hypothetical protein
MNYAQVLLPPLPLLCMIQHRWKRVSVKKAIASLQPISIYQECSRCKGRRIILAAGDYQSVDMDWLTGNVPEKAYQHFSQSRSSKE